MLNLLKCMKNLYYKIITLSTLLLPVSTFAQGYRGGDDVTGGKTFSTFVYSLGGLFNTLFALIIGASFVAFLWGLTIRLVQIGNSDKQKEAKQIMVWGIIGLLVSISIFGILSLGVATFATI